ncbi:ABC transporter permease [Agrobacterium rhizogenes]|nr:ABC transporter permease [Rhizobium rhizogenes]
MSEVAATSKGERRNSGASSFLRSTEQLLPSMLLVLIGLGLPLVLMARYSLAIFEPGAYDISGYSLANYISFFLDPFYLQILGRTLLVAFSCTALCLVFGVPAAYLISRIRSPILRTILLLTMIIPLLLGNGVRSAGWMMLLSDGGMINSLLRALGLIEEPIRILYTGHAVVISLLALTLPFMIISLQSVFESLGRAYEEAALTMGAGPWRTLFRVTLPLAMPGIFSGCLLCFVQGMNAYASPVLLGGPQFQMMAPKVYEQAIKINNWPLAATLAFVLMGVTMILTVISSLRLQKRYGAL